MNRDLLATRDGARITGTTMQISIGAHPDSGYPGRERAGELRDQLDLKRAVEVHRFFYPSVSVEALFAGNRALGLAHGEQLIVLAAAPRHVVFTANSDTPYASGALVLASGPMVVDLPPGPYIGVVNDHHQRWIVDMGIPGPDGGRGGKYVLVPPGYDGELPGDAHVAHAPTYEVLLALRAMPRGGDVSAGIDALRRVKVYPLGDPSRALEYVDVTNTPLDATPLRWEDNLEYFRRLAGIVEVEPAIDEHRAMYGELAALGIEKGAPFAPTPRMAAILDRAAKIACDEMRVEAFASERPDRIVWEDRAWEWVGLVPQGSDFERADVLDVEARERWFFQAILASPAIFRRKAGPGSVYFLAARDGSGTYLDGSRTYVLRVPHPVPATLFWSVTAYDPRTRSQVQTPQGKAVLGSLHDTLAPDDGGAVELWFGPDAPLGREARWIRTEPGAGFFLYFRIYGPEGAALDGSWRLSDLEPVETEARDELRDTGVDRDTRARRSITTPDLVKTTRVGELRHTLGVPDTSTVRRVYDALDTMHGVDACMSALPAVASQAIRRGMREVGVEDGDVLLFSELMDAKSLFLTPNCDTIYFFTFLDLSRGPVVFEAPPGILAVIDDMWSRWVTDVGFAGPDRGEGGRYLIVPERYDGPLPEGGYYVARAQTSRVFVLGRAFLEAEVRPGATGASRHDPAPAVRRIREGLKIGPYVPGGVGTSVASFLDGRAPFGEVPSIPSPRFVEGTGLAMNAVPPNDFSFFELLADAVQQEPAETLDPEIAGHLAAIGIVKGRPFDPDDATRANLEDAIVFANAAARVLSFRARDAEEFLYYGPGSRWMNNLFFSGYDFLRPPPLVRDGRVEHFPPTGARALHARTVMFYLAFGITPAMCMRLPGVGSQYLAAMVDARGNPFDGSTTYTLTLPPNIPAAAFWSVTLYDNQTRSLLDTPQRFPRAGSQSYPTPAAEASADGSTTIVFGPKRPKDVPEGNFVTTLPGQGWFTLLRLYSPLEPFFDKSWRPGDIEERG